MRSAVQIRPAAPRKALSLNGFKAFLLLLFLPVFLIWGERGVNIFRELINDIYGFRFRRGNDVRVNVAGGADLGVPQIAGDHNQGGSLCKQQTGIGVTKGMYGAGGQPGPFDELPEPLCGGGRENGPAYLVGENPIIFWIALLYVSSSK